MQQFVRIGVPFTGALNVLYIALFVSAVSGTVIHAAQDVGTPSKSSGVASTLLQSYEWYDGRQKRTVWLNPGLLAEFRLGTLEGGKTQKPLPGVSLQKQRHGVRIWKIDTGSVAETFSERRDSDLRLQAGYAPVFHDVPNASGSMRSLPGNVIVYLDPDWGADRIGQWLQQNGYLVVKRLEMRANAYILKTGTGIEALQLANKLYQSGQVVAAFPDWWLETATR